MQPGANHPWQLELNDEEHPIFSFHELAERVDAARQLSKGRLVLSEVIGPAPLWKRALGTKQVSRGYFAVEWFNQVASLIFLDENWSEYRALDRSVPVAASEEERSHVSHGEAKPAPLEECMAKERAFIAIAESLESSARPVWLQYRVVS
jgi:hypothetical protein